jgi:DNA-binding response OmpR family regulator
MPGKTILIIDDDTTLLELLSDHLKQAGYQPVCARDGTQALQIIEAAYSSAAQPPDIILLDVMMPGISGWEVCRRLREKMNTPVIMLTAKSEEIDKLRGFRLGVDDYVTKPFSFAELTARVSAVLARASRQSSTPHSVTSGDLYIDLDRKLATLAGQVVDLTPTEYRLLEVLARHSPRTVPLETLVQEIWGEQCYGEVEHVKHFIWTLRKKVEANPGDPQHILTERGFGYRFE